MIQLNGTNHYTDSKKLSFSFAEWSETEQKKREASFSLWKKIATILRSGEQQFIASKSEKKETNYLCELTLL